MRLFPPKRLEKGQPMNHRYRDPCRRWPQHDGYREVERMADVALMPADEVPDDTVQWLWPDTVPLGHLTLVAGEPASGKSFWMYDLAARVSFARPWPHNDHESRGGPPHGTGEARVSAEGCITTQIQNPKSKIQNGCAIIVNSDDGFAEVQQPRLAAAQANMPNVGLMRRLPPGSRFSQIHSVGPVTDRLAALKAAIKEAGDCRLAIVDDLARFVRTGLGKVTRADLLLALESLKCIAGECNVAMVVVWRLERTGRASARHLESFLPAAAMAWLVAGDPNRDGLRWAVQLKNHFGPLGDPLAFRINDGNVVWQPPPDVVPADVTGAFVRKSDRRLEREAAGKWALARMAEGPVEADVLWQDAEALGFSRRTLRRALADLGLKPTKCGNDGPWMWFLKAEGRRQKAVGDEQSVMGEGQGDRETRGHGEATAEGGRQKVEEGLGEADRASVRDSAESYCKSQIANCKFQNDASGSGQGSGDRSPTTKTQDLSPKTSAINPKSKIENPKSEDGQLAPISDASAEPQGGPPEASQNPPDDFGKTDAGQTERDMVTIVVLHPNVPGAEVTALDAAARPKPP
jgi:hypothetical protein